MMKKASSKKKENAPLIKERESRSEKKRLKILTIRYHRD